MAFPVAGGDRFPPPIHGHPFPVKRRAATDYDGGSGDDSTNPRAKRIRYPQYGDPVAFKAADELHGFPHLHSHPQLHPHPHPHPHFPHPRSHRSSPEPGSCSMERTASGHSIRSDPTEGWALTELLEDEEAAQRVRTHLGTFRRRCPDSKHERILRSIINPRNNAEYPLDKEALESIFSAANEIFFNGRLSQRVAWDWSHESSDKYDSEVIGTTALRRASTRGFETLIVLSSPILHDAKYSRRLLISTFLHELIHSYLFICCGFRARHYGGHTPGFQTIAKLVDNWIGPESGLYLSCMEADLDRFRAARQEDDDEQQRQKWDDDEGRYPEEEGGERIEYSNVYFPCSGLSEQQDYPSDGGGGQRDQYYHSGNSNGNVNSIDDRRSNTATTTTATTTWWTQRAVRTPIFLNKDDLLPANYTFYTNGNTNTNSSTSRGY